MPDPATGDKAARKKMLIEEKRHMAPRHRMRSWFCRIAGHRWGKTYGVMGNPLKPWPTCYEQNCLRCEAKRPGKLGEVTQGSIDAAMRYFREVKPSL